MDKSFMAFMAFGIGAMYLLINFIGDIQKEDDFTGSPEEYIYHVLHKWAGSSGGPVIEVMISGVLPSMSPLLWWDEHQQMLHAFQDLGKLIYNETQTWLKHRGITEIKVLRSGGYEGRNYTSWSLNWGGARHAPNRKLHKKTFPASRVWSTPATGVGTLAESEIVILGK